MPFRRFLGLIRSLWTQSTAREFAEMVRGPRSRFDMADVGVRSCRRLGDLRDLGSPRSFSSASYAILLRLAMSCSRF